MGGIDEWQWIIWDMFSFLNINKNILIVEKYFGMGYFKSYH